MTLDTKALQAAVGTADNRNRCLVCDWPLAESADKGCVPGDCSYRPNGEEWSRIQAKREFYARVKQEVLATRSESLPDELKAIAERHAKADINGTFKSGCEGILHNDRAALLTFIPDVVRACASQVRAEDAGMWEASRDVAEYVQGQILSILDQPIKSESKIREEERQRCAVYLEGCAQGLEFGWDDSTPPAENTASANVLRIHAAMLRNGNAS